ncbi:MAG: rod shape-determining protein MreC [Acidobacteriota bacterium]
MERRKGLAEKKKLFFIGVLFLNLVLISNSVVLKNNRSILQNIFHSFFSPFQIVFQKSVDFISSELRSYVFLKNSFKKFREIKKKQSLLKYENYILRKKLEDFESLNEAKKIFDKFIDADLISIDSNFPLSGGFINKGSILGVKKNMVVLNNDMELVGKIVEPVTFFSSKVRFITNSVGGIGAYIDKNKMEGLLKGNNSRNCSFNYLIENKPVTVGDLVVTSGTDLIYPPYLKIGNVVKIEKKVLVQNVIVKPFFIEKSIKKLFLIKND